MEVARLGLGCCYFDQIEYFLKKKITLRQQEAQKCGFRAGFAIGGPQGAKFNRTSHFGPFLESHLKDDPNHLAPGPCVNVRILEQLWKE